MFGRSAARACFRQQGRNGSLCHLAADIRAGLAEGRFRVRSPQTAADLILGVGLGVKDAAKIAHRSITAPAIARRAGR